MKNLSNIKIGNITLLTALKALTICLFGTYLFSVFTFGFFDLFSYITFICAVALFLICTHKPKHNLKMFNSNQLQKMPFKIILFILLINFSASAQNKPTDVFQKDTLIKSVNYKIYKGIRGGRFYYKLNSKNEFQKRYIKKIKK